MIISFNFAAKADVSDNDLLAEAGDDWVQTNGNLAGHRFSTLDQINANNASSLKVDWIYSTGGSTNAQGPVIEHDGMLFFVQDNQVHGIDAATGERKWRYDYEMPEDFGGQFNPFFTGKHRGAAIYGANVYALTSDCTLLSLDYKTGEEVFAFKIPPLLCTIFMYSPLSMFSEPSNNKCSKK
jgi:glucose dehydrogenase